jgi:hypothetical protein
MPSVKLSGPSSGLPDILNATINAPKIIIEIMDTNPSHLMTPSGPADIVFSK